MRFSLATAALVGYLQLASALPSQSSSSASSIEPAATVDDVTPSEVLTSDNDHNSTEIDPRGLFTTYPCKAALKIKVFKSWYCKGSSTRTDILNWPLPEGYIDKCQEVQSVSFSIFLF